MVDQRVVRQRFATELERTVRALRVMHYSYRTEESYLGWAVRFLTRSGLKTGAEANAEQLRRFLEELAVDPRGGKVRRHHIDPSTLQRAVLEAAKKSGMVKHVTPHVLRHSLRRI
jgi:integrase